MKLEKAYVVLLSVSLFYIISSAGNNITQKICMDKFTAEYSFYVIQIMNISYVILGLLMLIPLQVFKVFTEEQLRFKKSHYLLIASVDSFGILLQGIGNQYTPGILQTLLGQIIIPSSIILSVLILKKKYRWISYLGASIVIVGIIISFIPDFGKSLENIKWYSCIVYTVGVIFMSLSFVLKERAFSKGASPYILTVWVAMFMVPITFIIFPIQSIPGLGDISITSFPKIIKNGFLCTLGITRDKNMSCHNAGLVLVLFCLFSFISGVSAVILTEKASAVVKTLVNGFTIPVTGVSYSLYFIMGKWRENFNIFDIVAMIIVIIGFSVYSYEGYKEQKKNEYRSMEFADIQ